MITVYGSSDDLIEVEGDVDEEFNYRSSTALAFSDGTLLLITYTFEGVWRISPLLKGPHSVVSISQATIDDESNYSDVAVIIAVTPVQWVVVGADYATAKRSA